MCPPHKGGGARARKCQLSCPACQNHRLFNPTTLRHEYPSYVRNRQLHQIQEWLQGTEPLEDIGKRVAQMPNIFWRGVVAESCSCCEDRALDNWRHMKPEIENPRRVEVECDYLLFHISPNDWHSTTGEY